jgi:hypothetical protein
LFFQLVLTLFEGFLEPFLLFTVLLFILQAEFAAEDRFDVDAGAAVGTFDTGVRISGVNRVHGVRRIKMKKKWVPLKLNRIPGFIKTACFLNSMDQASFGTIRICPHSLRYLILTMWTAYAVPGIP